MSKKINDIIRLAYEPPEPLEKERFLAGFREAPIGHPEFVLRQFGFIKKRIWFLYSLMFAATLFIGTQAIKNAEEALWWFSAALPFLTIFLVTELSRSISCNMAKLYYGAFTADIHRHFCGCFSQNIRDKHFKYGSLSADAVPFKPYTFNGRTKKGRRQGKALLVSGFLLFCQCRMPLDKI